MKIFQLGSIKAYEYERRWRLTNLLMNICTEKEVREKLLVVVIILILGVYYIGTTLLSWLIPIIKLLNDGGKYN